MTPVNKGMMIGRSGKLILLIGSFHFFDIIGSEFLIGTISEYLEKGSDTKADDDGGQDECLR